MKRSLKAALLALAVSLLLIGTASAADAKTVSGSFPLVDGMDVATVRYIYEENGQQTYGFAEVSQTDQGYAYSFTAPADDFVAVEAASTGDITGATVVAEYFSTTRWDGAVDVSWYNETDSEFYIYTPAQFAGLAAVVNGSVDGGTPDYRIKGDRSYIVSTYEENGILPARGVGPLHTGLAEHDFSDRTVYLMSDLDMGGADGSAITHYGYNDVTSHYDYPNWMPIGGQFLADVNDFDSMVTAYFNGTFDGNGHRITNLYCYRRNDGTDPEGRNNAFCYGQGTGLFGAIGTLYDGEEAPANAPTLRNFSLSGYVYGRRMVGGLVGYAGGGSNSVEHDIVSNVCIENCANHAYVYNTDSKGVAGIVATVMVQGRIINCYNTGNISTNYANPAGGIVGSNEGMDIYCCYNLGSVYSSNNSRGRGIGSNGDSGANYTVNNSYYLHGCGDDSTYPGYYTANLAPSVSVTTAEVSSAQVTDGTLLSLLNVNGTAYVADSDGTPVLYWEKNPLSEHTVTLTKPEGGTITPERTGAVKTGAVVYMSNAADTGWSFRYYTLNGSPLTGAYATINGDSVLSGVFEAVQAGVLNIAYNEYCDVTVKKNGVVEQDGEMVQVTNHPVNNGDPLYEGDVLTVTATLREGVVPVNEDMIFSAAAGLSNPYNFTYTYTDTDVGSYTTYTRNYTVTSSISLEGTTLLLEVTPLETQKLWRYEGDTSWYSDASSSFTITTARQLAGVQTLVLEGKTFSGKTIRLGSDISMVNDDGTSGKRFWDGIGNSNKPFMGIFDGQGHSITDLHGNAFGLFAYVTGTAGSPAVIKDVSVYGDVLGLDACGILAHGQYAAISGCSVYSTIQGSGSTQYSAGILGNDKGGCTVTDCFNYGSVSGLGQVGGIAGLISTTGSVSGCVNEGDVSCAQAGNYNVGGVVGNLSGTVTACANTGRVTSAGRNTGGLAGQSINKAAAITDCYNAGAVTYDGGTSTLDSVGGVIGFASYYNVTNAHNYAAVTKLSGSLSNNIGGVFGRDGKKSTNTTAAVYYNSDVNQFPVMSTSDLGDFTYWSGINGATAAQFALNTAVLAGVNGNSRFVLPSGGAYPVLNYEASALHVHSGGTATCVARAVCDQCGLEYGELDPDNHVHTELQSRREAVWNVDGCTGDVVCLDCGAITVPGEPIPADDTLDAFTVSVVCEGETILTKTYTIAEFDALKSETTVGYSFGSSLMVSSRYVTIASLLDDVDVPLSRLEKVQIKGNGVQETLTKERYETCNKYFAPDGSVYDAPAAIAISWNTGGGSMEILAADEVIGGTLRLGYGLSDPDDSTPGARLISPVDQMIVTLTEETAGSVTGAITGYAGEGTVSVTLAQGGQTVHTAQVDAGNSYYEFTGVADGDYTLSVSADGDYVTHEYAVSVSGSTVQDVCIYQLGDVDMSGARRASDVTAIGKHVARIDQFTDSYVLLLADVNRDGNIRSDDVTRLGQFVAKIIDVL